MQHELERLGTTPSQSMLIGVGRPTCKPPTAHRRWSLRRRRLLTRLYEGQEATVLQLPAETRVAVEAEKREPVT